MHLHRPRKIGRNEWIFFNICFLIYIKDFVFGKYTLSESVSYFEPVEYSKETLLLFSHSRIRKSTKSKDELHLDFKAHGRHFNVRLKRERSLFSQKLSIADAGSFHPSNVYDGYLLNEPLSFVHGFIHDDIFEGRIQCNDGSVYYIDSSKQYDGFGNDKIQSVIYNAKDFIDKGPYHCGSLKSKLGVRQTPDHITHIDKHSDGRVSSVKNRQERSVDSKSKKLACSLQLRADPTYVAYANGDRSRAMYMMVGHVKSARNIFEAIDFNGDGIPEGYSLVIKRITAIDTSTCRHISNSSECEFKRDPIEGADDFLKMVTTLHNSQFCLSYVFCHRNFKYGTLGLAWQGIPDIVTPGGICSSFIKDNSGVMRTLNTGIVSNTVDGRTVSRTVTDLVLTHEIAHSFGSLHDDRLNVTCVPRGSDGNYLMYPEAQYQLGKNSFLLSPCSKAAILKNLETKSEKCFIEKTQICGNKEVETGEDCDCGYTSDDSCRNDPCCQGASTNELRNTGCKHTLKAKHISVAKRCSPSQGICCNPQTCSPYKNNTIVCSQANKCIAKVSMCVETSHLCPKPKAVPERSLCANGSKTCINGECSGSACLLINKRDCQCVDQQNLCHVCCQNNTDSSSCNVYSKKNVKRPSGSLCNQDKGRCENSRCLNYDEEGILTRIKKWLFKSKTFVKLITWAQKYWWACLLISIGVLIIIIVVVLTYRKYFHSDNITENNDGNEGFVEEIPLKVGHA